MSDRLCIGGTQDGTFAPEPEGLLEYTTLMLPPGAQPIVQHIRGGTFHDRELYRRLTIRLLGSNIPILVRADLTQQQALEMILDRYASK